MKNKVRESAQNCQETQKKRYFAFISYSRRDMAAADYVQRTLEHFRYPKESIRKELHPEDGKYVREIFLDRTTLSGQGDEFEKRLEAALSNSRYLIVICSSNAVRMDADPNKKHYVEWEINTFLKHHGDVAQNRIIPVVLEGEPTAKEGSCLPVPLRKDEFIRRNIPDMRPHTGQGGKSGGKRKNWHSAIITLLSYLFDVERSIIFDRFAVERAKMHLRIAIGAMAGTLTFGVLVAWGVFEQHRAEDREAERHFVEAVGIVERGAGEVFSGTGLALAHLSRAARMPLANEYLMNLVVQRSWILPQRKRSVTDVDMGAFIAKNTLERILCPDGFPLVYKLGDGRLTAHERSAAMDGSGREIWRVGESSNDYGFWGMSGLVSSVGRTLVVLRLPRNGHAQYEIVALNPFTGQRMWGRSVPHAVRFCSFSPDGRRLAVLSPIGTLRILDALTGEAEFEPYEAGEDALDVTFSQDGNHIAILTKNHTLECSLVKNIGEFIFKPTGYPIVAISMSDDGREVTLDMNTGGTLGFSDTYDCRTFERIRRVDLTNAVVRAVSTASQASSADGRFRAKVADGRFMKSVVRLFDSRSQSPVGRLLQFPDEVTNISFARLSGRDCLLVLGGSAMSSIIANTGFYAVVDPGTGRMLCLRHGLPQRFDTLFPMGENAVLVSGYNSNECRLAVLPPPDAEGSAGDTASICRLLGGMELDDLDMPKMATATLDDTFAGGITGRFLAFARTDAEARTVSAVSDMPFRFLLEGAHGKKTLQKDREWRDIVLSVVPGNSMAWEDGFIGDLREIYRANYSYAHPGMTRHEIDMALARLAVDDWLDALNGDAQVRFYADRITSYMLDLHPEDESVRKTRTSTEEVFDLHPNPGNKETLGGFPVSD